MSVGRVIAVGSERLGTHTILEPSFNSKPIHAFEEDECGTGALVGLESARADRNAGTRQAVNQTGEGAGPTLIYLTSTAPFSV